MNTRFLLSILASTLGAASATAQWTQQSPLTSPSARKAPGMACNPATSTILMFGGFLRDATTGPLGTALNDTWSYDGATWTQIAAVNPPSSSTSGKYYTQMAYDISRSVYVLFGGSATTSGGGGSNETWEFDEATSTWTQRTLATNPSARYLHAMVYDAARGVVVLYGGSQGFGAADLSDTWEYNGVDWTLRSTTVRPGPLEGHSMAFDLTTGRTILFGGANQHGIPPYNDKTWAWNGTNWTELTVTGPRPGWRERAGLAADDARGVCVLVGGMRAAGWGSGPKPNDTWELTTSGNIGTWRQVSAPVPGGNALAFYRFDSSLAFLPGQRTMVQFGGYDELPDIPLRTFYGDTAEYGARSGIVGVGCAGTNGVPSLSAVDAPRQGLTYTVNVANMNPAFNFAILAFGFTPLPGIDLGPVIGMTGCNAYHTGDIMFTAPAGAGGATSWSWTPVTANLGDVFYCQALCLDPTVNTFGFTITNAISATVGH